MCHCLPLRAVLRGEPRLERSEKECHCEEQSDEAISNFGPKLEIATAGKAPASQ